MQGLCLQKRRGFFWSLIAGDWAGKAGGQIFFGALSGGIGAELSGGNFWQGAVIGGIVAGLNHAMHEIDSTLDDDVGGDGPGPKKKSSANERSGSNQDKRLSPGEIKKLKDASWDHSEKGVNGKGGGQKDLWKDKNGR